MSLRNLSIYRKKRDFEKTAEPSGDDGGKAVQPAAVRHPEARRHPPALRSQAGVRRRLQVLGGDARPLARSARQAARGGGGGPSARLRRFRRHHSEGPVWRRHRAALGSRLLGIRSDPEKGFRKGDLKFTLDGDKLRRQLGAGADAPRPRRRQTHQLAADQASRRVRQGGQRQQHPRRRTVRRVGSDRWTRSPPARAGRPSRS